ncbi:MarR family winged helix-turn-helix transcriptional regulator [Nocardia brasiliensis]|uniref:MarR family winged helix-turn-helix transcriptional regulator n=1 Tax=Nocardia brasiliensis TaxID=37326 RepID=UPI003D925233
MTDPHPSDVSTLPRALGRLRVVLDESFQAAARRQGLTSQQAELLCAALRPTAIGDLAVALRCDRSNVSRLVDRVAVRGLLVRAPAERDGRVSVVELTDAGKALAHQFIAELERLTAALLAEWSPRKQRQAVTMLERISSAITEESSTADTNARFG